MRARLRRARTTKYAPTVTTSAKTLKYRSFCSEGDKAIATNIAPMAPMATQLSHGNPHIRKGGS